MTVLQVFIALLMIMAAGFGAGSLLFEHNKEVFLTEVLALSWLLGTMFVSLSLACLGIVSSGLVLYGVVTAACVVLGVLGVRSWRGKALRTSLPKPSGILEWALCVVLLVEFAAVLCLEYRESLGWDGLLVWEIKARYAFLNGGVLPPLYFTDATRLWSHPEYPLFYPLIEAWLYFWIGDCDQFLVRAIFPVFYVAAAFLLYAGAYRLSGKTWAGLIAACSLFFLPGQWNFLGGFVDFPLAIFYFAALVYFLRYLREPSGSHVAFFSLLAGGLPWVKREGMILWCCLIAMAALEFLRRRQFRRALLVPLPGLAVCAAWKIAMMILKTPPGADFLPLAPGTAFANLGRMVPVIENLVSQLADIRTWSLLWGAFAVALACLAFRSQRSLATWLFLSVALPLGIESSIYIFSAWPSYLNHIHTSLPRLIMQVSLGGLLAITLAAAADDSGAK